LKTHDLKSLLFFNIKKEPIEPPTIIGSITNPLIVMSVNQLTTTETKNPKTIPATADNHNLL